MPTRYSIRHITRFNYDVPVSESLMEVRMQPRTEGTQRCLRFELAVAPRARVFAYRDHLGNSVHHFDTPARHTQLTITARAYVELDSLPAAPGALDPRTWREVDTWTGRSDLWDFLQPSRFAQVIHVIAADLLDLDACAPRLRGGGHRHRGANQ